MFAKLQQGLYILKWPKSRNIPQQYRWQMTVVYMRRKLPKSIRVAHHLLCHHDRIPSTHEPAFIAQTHQFGQLEKLTMLVPGEFAALT
jgi:hypothetical protein